MLISDNASTDGTKNLVEGQQAAGVSLTYFRNDTNLGADRNFVQCFQRARGKYLQLLGDDDVLLEGALERILGVLRSHEAGVVHLKGYGFRDDYRKEHPRRPGSGEVLVYRDPREFAAKVNINLTFISGNVVNRTMVLDLAQWEACLDTNLVQLGWIVPAALAAPVNVVIDEYLVAAKAENTGGYRLCRVFGLNMQLIFDQFIARGMDPRFFQRITQKTVMHFFPAWILQLRTKEGDFHSEDHFETLRPIFNHYAAFWLMVWPSARWPRPLAKHWLRLCKNGLKLIRQW